MTIVHHDVCIVGGGPAGLSAAHAVLAARPNLRVAVCERAELRPRGAIVFLPPNGVRAIEAISPALKAALQRHHTTHLKTRSFSPAGELKASSDEGGPSAKKAAADGGERIMLPWHQLQGEMADALPEGVLRTSHRFLRYTETEEGVVAEFDTPEGPRTVHASLLLGCDGGQSAVREQLLGDGPPQYLGMAIWRAVRPHPREWPVDTGHVGWTAMGGASCLTHAIGDKLIWQAFAPWPEEKLEAIGGGRKAYIQDLEGLPAQQDGDAPGVAAQQRQRDAKAEGQARLARALSAFEGYPDTLIGAIASTDPLAVTEHGQFCREVEECQTYARGRVALTGDAAHLGTPFLGQGCSQAIEDALELGRAVGIHGPSPAALAAYQEVRLPLAGEVQATSVQMFRDFRAGTLAKSEFDVNAEKGFVRRTFAPLKTAAMAAA